MPFVILWEPLPLPMEPERPVREDYGPDYLVHAKNRLKPLTWPTEAQAQAVLDADLTRPLATVVPLGKYAAILDAQDRSKRRKNFTATEEVADV
jgi:hypothetical protein